MYKRQGQIVLVAGSLGRQLLERHRDGFAGIANVENLVEPHGVQHLIDVGVGGQQGSLAGKVLAAEVGDLGQQAQAGAVDGVSLGQVHDDVVEIGSGEQLVQEAVSYTHLDVYKRQHLEDLPMDLRERGPAAAGGGPDWEAALRLWANQSLARGEQKLLDLSLIHI